MSKSREGKMNHKETLDQKITGSDTETAASEESNHPNVEEIARRAYEIFLERGGVHGQDLDDWVRAERELREKSSQHEQLSQEESEQTSEPCRSHRV